AAASSLLTSGRFAVDPELRGSEFERVAHNLDIHFWKSFWNMTETQLLAGFQNLSSCSVSVSRVLSLPPVAVSVPLAVDPRLRVSVPPPSAHSGPADTRVRLISSTLRQDQVRETRDTGRETQRHGERDTGRDGERDTERERHGGGFVAQTSRSHEPYLRDWATDLDCPVLSVDYSLAPESPFPRALEECFYAYCWALTHHNLLGWTGERVCLAGDSAGGNLCLSVCLRAAEVGVRVPDGILAVYPAAMLGCSPSPSRLLALMDPMLPLGVLSKCLSAYAGGDSGPVAVATPRPALGLRGDAANILRGIRNGASDFLLGLLTGRATS
ncbi:unnamed protein product, partial [Lampetra fluviatilis]